MVVGVGHIEVGKTGNPGTEQAAVEPCTSSATVNVVAVVVFQAADRYSVAVGKPAANTAAVVAAPGPGKIPNYGPLSKTKVR